MWKVLLEVRKDRNATKGEEFMISVFTPVYNRAYIIHNLYESLCNQTSKDFEWLVVDDGSTDHIEELVREWMNESKINIVYHKKKNGGKHTAINEGVKLARGEAFLIVDSDDYLCNDAIEFILPRFDGVCCDDSIAGIAVLKGRREDEVVGQSPLFDQYVDATNLEREQYGLNGDKCNVFKTEVLKEYPFPVFEGENFMTEAVVWDKMAYDGYKMRWFNKIVYLCEYLEDGLSRNLRRINRMNPRGWGLYLYQSSIYRQWSEDKKRREYCDYYKVMTDFLDDNTIISYLRESEEYLKEIKREYRKDFNNVLHEFDDFVIVGYLQLGQEIYKELYSLQRNVVVCDNYMYDAKTDLGETILSVDVAVEKHPHAAYIVTSTKNYEVVKKQLVSKGINELNVIQYIPLSIRVQQMYEMIEKE